MANTKTALAALQAELAAMRGITDRAPWGGGLRSMPKADQDTHAAHDAEFNRIAAEAGLTEAEALQLCARFGEMKNETVEVNGAKWLVRQAVSRDEAEHAIAMARCTGSVGGKHTEVRNGVETVKADVVRLNDDGTECKPS